MVDAKLTAAIVTGVLSIVLIVIAVIISLSIGSKFPAGDTKSRLQASAALSGLTALFAIGTGVAGILYARAKRQHLRSARPLLIVMIVLAVITALMYITVLGLNLSVRALQDVSTTDKNALTAAIIPQPLLLYFLDHLIVLFVSIRKAALVAKKTTTEQLVNQLKWLLKVLPKLR